ncbi:CocE/NonD family hydrolase [Variovorax sp. KBS0712]|uniref:CocE/NonD family hydrolase n=1 Tax=Variovorax sp. KBS0712 TaxID=2578111 RepID=UPI001C8F9439|nr:CocE/NonD family hydrolase [Variovorax sp. KBS0712]
MPELDLHVHTEIRDGMRITWNQPIRARDGAVLRADIFRPIGNDPCPVILTLGMYGKGLSYQESFTIQWDKMVEGYPDILEGSTNKYQNWEVSDPERWVPQGYAVMRVDSRGIGWSEGVLDPFGPNEERDIHDSIEWAGTQPWSTGKVAVMGISYYAIMAWRAAQSHPSHLAAVLPWEGLLDVYRDLSRHGGILSEFTKLWASKQAVTVQYGVGSRAKKNPNTGVSVAGPIDLSQEELARNRLDHFSAALAHEMDGPWWRERSTDARNITVPFLSSANWGGQGIHPRGNFMAFTDSPSPQKWLEVHGELHWSIYSAKVGMELQQRFLDHFLKGKDNGWDRQPPVMLGIRHWDGRFVPRAESAWPISRTQWTRHYLHADTQALSTALPTQSAGLEYEALGDGLLFKTAPLERETEITGPIAATLHISSSTADADLFLIVSAFDPEGNELTFQGALDPNTPIAQGWLRASHRRLDAARSKPWQPVHSHDVKEPLVPGEVHELQIEILPTCIVLPAGWRLSLAVRGKDYEYGGELSEFAKTFHYATKGTGGMTHNDAVDRPAAVFGGTVTLHTGPEHPSFVLLPVIPAA